MSLSSLACQSCRNIRVFFDHMVAINIFHEPSFAEKLSNISSFSQLTALLAAIAGYASRFGALRTNDVASDTVQLVAKSHRQPAYFINLAFKFINEALAECDDEMPPLCVIQALIIATHCRLTQGVRGKAWRSLGLCVSLIYETNLHLLDSRKVIKAEDPHHWQEDEEKRRAFWAIWEMDVFASTIRRMPTTINWNQMEILLPVDNAHWFSGHPTSSCFMEADINKRWKALQDSGNQSSKAWFLVINSLMKNAQIACDPQGASAIGSQGYHQQMPNSQISTLESAMETRRKLETLANAVRCFTLALPSHLQYRDQYLAFWGPVQGQTESQRLQHCSIYNIFVMTQLARLMIYRYDAFRSQNHPTETSGRHPSGNSAGRSTFSLLDTENGALRQYYEAADRILGIVNRSCEDHVQHINPFLPSTIWLASAVQLVRKHFARTQSNRDLVKSRFDVLYLTYKRCVQFWDIQTALQKNLELIEEQLEARTKKPEVQACPSSQEASNRASEDTDMINQSASDQEGHNVERSLSFDRSARQASQYLPETPSVLLTSSAPMDARLENTAQNHARKHPYVQQVAKMAASSNESRINLTRIAHVFYTHKEIDKAHQFLLDFGFQEVKRVGNDIYYRGTSSEPFVYCARRGENDEFGGAAFVVESESDLFAATKLPGATGIYDFNDALGGGRCVTFHDPIDKFPFHLVHGQKAHADEKVLPQLDYNFVLTFLPPSCSSNNF
ncbi:fungal-specific transcription factor domain-containing protein [Aspergillus pseudotamarii]|uniref:Fungal-specific transcription factor domain-containing protein n=1 Tax=Aspergillus pseudotamarii TaxID=132259 RepID=A0A5N6TAN5_ASPPS|nr:fungal-specific transcription factor domain-containing protein [Aspergillus pseudotamarii]KAE8143229.1 fungal-specific transcription factor domain-containing protein [Aspergillus pseudotamarii]